MQNPEIAALAHKIFGRGLDLKERLERGDSLRFDVEHAELRQLLWSEGAVSNHPDYAGDRPLNSRDSYGGDDRFLGARYALACWLDEIFIMGSQWSREWQEHPMEVEVVGYGASERAYRFWRQARRAASRPGTDALEVFLWCTMLGFHGDPSSEGIDIREWADKTRNYIIDVRNQKFRYENGAKPQPDVPPLSGRVQFRRMLRVGTAVLAVGLFSASFLILRADTERPVLKTTPRK
jgi:hypothetical protein